MLAVTKVSVHLTLQSGLQHQLGRLLAQPVLPIDRDTVLLCLLCQPGHDVAVEQLSQIRTVLYLQFLRHVRLNGRNRFPIHHRCHR
jgi:hypothetical protein